MQLPVLVNYEATDYETTCWVWLPCIGMGLVERVFKVESACVVALMLLAVQCNALLNGSQAPSNFWLLLYLSSPSVIM